ncbi:MAG: NUDIX hydrolase [Anaerolineales bacterium]|nr:NUDIX hydrolase [Anaerolineales bacterium]MCK4976971.1 NUDIX hydrolase [Anaerolineales bacterium]
MVRHTRYQGVVVRDHQALLIKHWEFKSGRGYWVIPGGGIELGESEEECVMRELKEETNLEVEVIRLLFEEADHPDGMYACRKTYLCRSLSGEPSPGFEPELEAQANYSIAEVRWFDLHKDSDWPADLRNDPFTYPQLARIRQALGYSA